MLQTEERSDVVVIRPQQDIVASYVDEFRGELQAIVEGGRTRLVIELDGVSIIDSKGLAVFMLCHKSVSTRGGSLTVVTTNEDFKHLFHVMRLDEHFAVVDSL